MAATKIDLSSRVPRKSFTASDIPGLFGSAPPQPQDVVQLALSQLTPWADQPFRPYPDAKLRLLAEDIKANGVMNPIIVRPYGAQYQILAGHNRWNASRLAGLATIPAIVRDVDDDDATLIMVNTNLLQREELLPSEKAFAYKLQLEAMKRQGQRNSTTSSQIGMKSQTLDLIGKEAGDSRNQVHRYIRLTALIPELLDMVNSSMLGFIPAVELSYLPWEAQQLVCEVSADCEKKISLRQAVRLREAGAPLTLETAREILSPAKTQWDAAGAFVTGTRRLIPKTATEQDIANLVALIEQYFKRGA